MVAEVGGHLGREDRTELMLLFPMVLGIIPVPSLGRGRGRTGGIQTGLVCGAAEGGGELGGHLHLAACILPQLSSVG